MQSKNNTQESFCSIFQPAAANGSDLQQLPSTPLTSCPHGWVNIHSNGQLNNLPWLVSKYFQIILVEKEPYLYSQIVTYLVVYKIYYMYVL